MHSRPLPCLLLIVFFSLLPGSPRLGQAGDRATWLSTQLATADRELGAAQREEKYAAMSESAFAFFRGTAYLFFLDLGTAPQLQSFGGTAQTRTWLLGDAHPQNFGSFRNARGTLVYDLNDFDEAVLADYQLDVWRLATALVLVMRQTAGFTPGDELSVLDSFSQRYLDTLAACVGNDRELTTTIAAENSYGKLDEFLKHVDKKRSRARLLATYTALAASGQRQLSPSQSPDLAAVPDSLVAAIVAAMPAYGQSLVGTLRYSPSYFAVKSVAQRLHAGLGSLGLPRYYVLIEGPTASQDDDLILDVKAQGQPAAYRNLAAEARAATEAASDKNPAQRVVVATRSLGLYVDELVGVLPLSAGPHSVRERSPWKDTLDLAVLSSVERLSKLTEQWATLLAYAHARADADQRGSGVRVQLEDEVVRRTLGKHDDFRRLVRSMAQSYASRVQADWQTFTAMRRQSR